MVQDWGQDDDGAEWPTVVTGGDWDGEARPAEASTAPHGTSTPLLMGESCPVWAKPTAEEDTDTEVELAWSEAGQGDDKPTDWMSSESMLWLSDHPSDTTGREQSISRQSRDHATTAARARMADRDGDEDEGRGGGRGCALTLLRRMASKGRVGSGAGAGVGVGAASGVGATHNLGWPVDLTWGPGERGQRYLWNCQSAEPKCACGRETREPERDRAQKIADDREHLPRSFAGQAGCYRRGTSD